MEIKIWELFLALVGSGVIFSLITWGVTKIKQSGTEEAKYQAHCEEVRSMKKHQDEQDASIRVLEKRIEDIDHNIDIRLTAIETDLSHIRELQMAHNTDLRTTAEDIKLLLRVTKKE